MDKQFESDAQGSGQAWEERILCSDESCIGVIGPDGRCKECGRPYEGPLPKPSQQSSKPQPSDDYNPPEDAQADDDAGGDDEGPDSEVADEEWQMRKLCRNESCIGVIGPDGRCKECGRPYDE